MIRHGPKRTIFTSGGIRLLQMVLEQDVGQCVSEDAGPQGVNREIPRWMENGTKHSL